MIAVYTTNFTSNSQAMQALYSLKLVCPSAAINFDLSDGEKILRIDGTTASIESITGYLKNLGIQCEILA